jgi:hypothetical protein
MAATLAGLVPIFLLIVLGGVLRARAPLPAPFWPAAEWLIYWLLFPALLFTTTAGSAADGLRILPVASAQILAILAVAGALLALRRRLALDDGALTSVLQGAIRSNVFVGLAGAAAIYGAAGLAIMPVVVLIAVTTVNLISVATLLRYGRPAAERGRLLGAIAGNPLILAVLGGFAAALLLPRGLGVLGSTLELLGRAALPLGLLCVGASLDLGALRGHRRATLLAAAAKLLALPLATAAGCRLLGVEGVTAGVAVLLSSAPVAPSSYVLARQLGGDAGLMASIITVTTVLAMVTMPLLLTLLLP